MRKFTPEEDDFLRKNYLTVPAKRMSILLGRSESAARQRMALLGLVAPPEVIERFRKESQFKKGQVSFNKGRKQSEYCSPEGIARSAKNRFKKGQLPPNTLYDMAITVRNDKRGVPYKFIRVSQSVWIPLQRYVWEKENGPLARGLKVIFKNGDTMDYRPENLEAVSCRELMQRNSVHNLPKPIVQTVQLRGVLNRQINKRIKQLKDEKQNQ
ncbi:HNH endonuclease signature motif containing protein [Chitinophaga rhizosphaerae]|uniref:HNH endonuclease signature motif containing protein n=1 Tax=Chitinophaga rhizosphaerae TaxID=1864947 RepID=UPI000F805F59|nr:HNH endonuclease signature motif containing protein [Chitinophaga rhizosphaerae]